MGTETNPAEPKCEGLAPFNCGNPSCPAHGTPAEPDAGDVEALTPAQMTAIRESLGWDWHPSVTEGIPSPDDALAETYEVVAGLLAEVRRTAAKETAERAWNEGWLAGFSNCTGTTDHRPRVENPYRIARAEADR